MDSKNPAEGGRRFTLLTEDTMTPRQREVYAGIVSGPRKGAAGPFNALLRSPEVADRVQKVGEYVRFQSSIPAPLNGAPSSSSGRTGASASRRASARRSSTRSPRGAARRR
jgi:hypothetical protein